MRWHQATLTRVGIVGMSRALDLVLFVSRLRRRLLYYRAKS